MVVFFSVTVPLIKVDCYLVIATFVKAEFLCHCHFYQGGHFGGPLSFDLGGIFRSSSLLWRWNFLKSLPLLSMWNFKVIVKIVSRRNYLVIESFVEKKKAQLTFPWDVDHAGVLPFDHGLHELLHQLVVLLSALPFLLQTDVQRVVTYSLKQTQQSLYSLKHTAVRVQPETHTHRTPCVWVNAWAIHVSVRVAPARGALSHGDDGNCA